MSVLVEVNSAPVTRSFEEVVGWCCHRIPPIRVLNFERTISIAFPLLSIVPYRSFINKYTSFFLSLTYPVSVNPAVSKKNRTCAQTSIKCWYIFLFLKRTLLPPLSNCKEFFVSRFLLRLLIEGCSFWPIRSSYAKLTQNWLTPNHDSRSPDTAPGLQASRCIFYYI